MWHALTAPRDAGQVWSADVDWSRKTALSGSADRLAVLPCMPFRRIFPKLRPKYAIRLRDLRPVAVLEASVPGLYSARLEFDYW